MSHFTTYVITSSYVPRILIPEGSRCLIEQGCYPLVRCTAFTGKDPRIGWRTPLNYIIFSEQRDEETGYGYFGARYMDHELMTMWLSVDPMADKYPSISPYAYCAWNPIKLVDPNGREFDGWRISGSGDVTWVNSNGGKNTQTVTYESTDKIVKYSGEQFYNIFHDLRKNNRKKTSWDGNIWGSSSSDNNGSDQLSVKRALVDVFYDMANNTNIEWALYQYGRTMAIGHLQRYNNQDGTLGRYSGENHAPALSDLGCFNAQSTGVMLHSHPNTPAEKELDVSIGWNNGHAKSGDIHLRENYPNMQYLVYMKRTQNLISIPYRKAPSIINRNTSKGDLYKMFNL